MPQHILGTVLAVAERAQNESQSINIPFLSFEQDILLYILKKAINEPHRGRGKRANAFKAPNHSAITSLTPEHHIFKSWLQYFRAIILKQTRKEIASTIQIAYSTYLRWERPSSHLPPSYWFDLLWRWWIACYMYINRDKGALSEPERLPQWEVVTTTQERLALRKAANPRYFHQLDLKRRQSIKENEK